MRAQDLEVGMQVREIYELLGRVSPFENQEAWDNGGLQIGGLADEVSEIVLSLEVDESVVERLKPKSLLITHHPLIFKPLKNLDFGDYPNMLVRELIKKECALIAMHTSFDDSHLNAFVAREALGFKEAYQEGCVAYVEVDSMDLKTLALRVRDALKLPVLKVVDAGQEIKKIAIVCGAGFGLLPQIKERENLCFLTGDIKYHDGMIARALGVSMIDIMHYESEVFFPQVLQTILQKHGYKAIIANSKNPFTFIKAEDE